MEISVVGDRIVLRTPEGINEVRIFIAGHYASVVLEEDGNLTLSNYKMGREHELPDDGGKWIADPRVPSSRKILSAA